MLAPADLESLHLNRRAVESSFFLHELFHDLGAVQELEEEMSLFWSGLLSAEEFAEWMTEALAAQRTPDQKPELPRRKPAESPPPAAGAVSP